MAAASLPPPPQQQEAALEQMKSSFSPAKDTTDIPLIDSTYLRYLRARKFDVAKATAMLQETIKWRNQFGVQKLMKGENMDIIRTENATGKVYVRGFSKEGHAIIYMKPKYENTKQHDGNLKHLVFNIEKAIAAMDYHKTGKEKWTILIDFDGYSIFNAPPINTSQETLRIFLKHYPERLQSAFCLNPPWIFTTFYTIISPLIDPVTKAKIHMVPANQVKSTLLPVIDEKTLESSYGGLDRRPFNSAMYLSAPVHKDFLTTLNDHRVPQPPSGTIATSATSSRSYTYMLSPPSTAAAKSWRSVFAVFGLTHVVGRNDSGDRSSSNDQ